MKRIISVIASASEAIPRVHSWDCHGRRLPAGRQGLAMTNNKMRKIFIIIVLVVMFASSLVACREHRTVSSEPRTPLKISVNVWPGYALAFLAKEKGFFEKNGVEVELLLKKNQADSFQVFKNAEADGSYGTLADAVLLGAQNFDSKVVYLVDCSLTGDVIMARKGINSLSDLKGKKVGFEGLNSFSQLFVLNALERAGLTEADLRFEIVNAHDVVNKISAGKIDAGHTWEPTTSEGLKKGYKVIASAADSPGIIVDVLQFSGPAIEKKGKEIKAFLKSLFEAGEYLQKNPDESLKIMATAMGMSEEEMQSGIKGLYFLDEKENFEWMSSEVPSTNSMFGNSINTITNFYLDRGQVSSIPKIEDIIDPAFIKELYNK